MPLSGTGQNSARRRAIAAASLGESNALAALGEGRSPARCAAINREGDEDKDSRSGPNDNCFASSV